LQRHTRLGLQCIDPCLPASLLSSSSLQVVCNRAAAAAKLGRHDESLSDAELAIELDASYAKAYVRRSQVLPAASSCSKLPKASNVLLFGGAASRQEEAAAAARGLPCCCRCGSSAAACGAAHAVSEFESERC
jgi:hypothetical protein